ncbi:MAG TPA: hypothetical protein VK453_28545 [Micromonosporaceae bacterium]|nr:hypothetical protein [Micromonosporaceae bacterium]
MGRYRRFAAITFSVATAIALGSTASASAQVPTGVRVELSVLVVTDGGPTTAAIADELTAQGVPFSHIDLRSADRPKVTPELLADVIGEGADAVRRGRYQAVVLPGANPLDAAEMAALADYERTFGVRQVNAYVWPDASVGLDAPTFVGPIDGITATVTAAGLAGPFGYLRGPVPFEDNSPTVAESYAFLAQPTQADPAGGTALTPLVTAAAPDGSAGDVLVGDYAADGRRQLVMTFAYSGAQQQFRLLAPGIVEWATGGVHLGLRRNYFSVHVDDILLPDARWSRAGNCTPTEDCPATVTTPDIRMTPQDVSAAVAWQTEQQFSLDLAFNAAGSAYARAEDPAGQDPLTDAFLAQRAQFRWINHTYSHEFLGCRQDTMVRPWRCETDPLTGEVRYASEALITEQVSGNLDWAALHDVPLDRTELVTGEHSGLKVLPQQPEHNPQLAPALAATGIAWLAADNSRMPTQLAIGPARTVPRHPLNVFFNVATRAEQVDEYNWIYTTRADGGSGICEDNPLTVTCIVPLDEQTGYDSTIVPLETRLALARILGNDPRPHFVHQSNLAEDRLIYPLLDSILGSYRALFADNTPIVCERMSAAGTALHRQSAWSTAVRAGEASAYRQDGLVVVTAPAGVSAPVTVPEGSRVDGAPVGEAYAGARSGYLPAGEGGPVTVVLP